MTDTIHFDPKHQPDRIQRQNQPYGPSRPQGVSPAGAPSFSETLQQAQEIRFSNHAQQRIEKRKINLGDDGINRLAQAVNKAEQKGGKSSLVLMDDMAFIVNVQERMVVTAMDSKARGKGVFTQIDTVVFADESEKSNSGSSTVEKTA
jgi:flagellar operon protein